MIKPKQDRVAVEKLEALAQTAGGIFIPDQAQEKPQTGRVLAVGPGRRHDDGTIHPVDAQVGEIVVFPKHAGAEVRFKGKNYLILSEREILGSVEGEI